MNTSEYASTGKKTGCAAGIGCIGIFLVLAFILFGAYKSSYNRLVQQDQNVKQAWSEVENDLQRRSDLIPNLVATVKGMAGQEQIAIARKGLIEPGQPLLKDIAAMGVQITHLSPAERDAFVKATRPVYDKWKNQIGADLVNQAEKAIAARKK